MIPVFGAPPLLNKITEKGELSAVLTYWHYQARLLPLGFNKIFPIKKVFQELNISDQIPIVGWVFDESWAKENPESISKFLKVSAKAKEIMSKSDEEWIKLRKIMKAKDEEIFICIIISSFVNKYCEAFYCIIKLFFLEHRRNKF